MRSELPRSMNSRFPEYRSGDDGLTKEHRLGHGQPESLGAMQGDVTITGLDQAVQLATGKV